MSAPDAERRGVAFEGRLELGLREAGAREGTAPGSLVPSQDGTGLVLDLPARAFEDVSLGGRVDALRRAERYGRLLDDLGTGVIVQRAGRTLLQVGRSVKPNWWLRALGFRSVRLG